MPIINEDLIVQEYSDKPTQERECEMVKIALAMNNAGEPDTKEKCFMFAESFARLGVILEMSQAK